MAQVSELDFAEMTGSISLPGEQIQVHSLDCRFRSTGLVTVSHNPAAVCAELWGLAICSLLTHCCENLLGQLH